MIYTTGEGEFDRAFETEIPGFAHFDLQGFSGLDSKDMTPKQRA